MSPRPFTGDFDPTVSTRVALALRDGGPQDLVGLSRSLDLTGSVVAAALRDLVGRDVVAAVASEPGDPASNLPDGSDLLSGDPGGGPGGAPVRGVHRFTGDEAVVVAVDVGPRRVRIAFCDLVGTLLHRVEVPAEPDGEAGPRIRATVEQVKAAQREAGIETYRLWACTFAVPAPVDGQGKVMESSLVPNWSGIDLAEAVSEALGCPVQVANDGTLSGIAEASLGEGVGAHDFVNVCLGRRLCVRQLVDGRPREGADHLAGSVAHLYGERIDVEGRIAWNDEVEGVRVVRRALDGDPSAVAQVEEVVDQMAFGLATTILHENPERVVVGGSIGSLLGPWRDRLADGVQREMRGVDARVDLRLSGLADDTVLAGALVLALEHATSAMLGETAPAALPRLARAH